MTKRLAPILRPASDLMVRMPSDRFCTGGCITKTEYDRRFRETYGDPEGEQA